MWTIDVRGAGLSRSDGVRDQAHFPAQYAPAQAKAWIPSSDAHPSRACDFEEPANQAARAAVGLSVGGAITMGAVRSLKRSEDFRRVRAAGARARRDGLTVFVAPATPGQPGGRAGITVPGAVGSAVVRNRLRRRLRAALQRTDLGRDRDVVVRVDPTAAGASYRELETNLTSALSRANEGLRA